MAVKTFALGLAIAALAAPAAAQDKSADDIASKIINQPAPGAFAVYNAPRPAKLYKDKAVQGGEALRVAIPAASDQPWSISLADPISKPVKKGDRLALALYAKVEPGEAKTTGAHIANASVQLAKAPYTGVFGAPLDIGTEWKLYTVATGAADRDYAAGELTVSLQLATAKQVLDIGPIFVLDLGPGQ
ncbi:MAG TPA: hypothetical protein VFT56_09720 [Sphingomonas sp.]|nr:hypothetical protein [Sphingomonas sp.]